MPSKQTPQLQDLAILTRAVENVFRKLIRFLVGRISLVKLQEMINFVYVDEAEKLLKLDYPGKNIPLTKLALLTGLDTRTVVRIKKQIELNDQQYQERFLRDLTPESAVVEAWSNLVEASSGFEKKKKSKLRYGEVDSEFERLFRSTISSRGITARSVIQRLLATKSITQNKSEKTISLIVREFSPYLSDDEPSMINAAFSAFSNLISTVEHNLTATGKDKLFQRQLWTFRLRARDRDEFRQVVRTFLESAETGARQIMQPWEAGTYSNELLSAGIGLYYFEESP